MPNPDDLGSGIQIKAAVINMHRDSQMSAALSSRIRIRMTVSTGPVPGFAIPREEMPFGAPTLSADDREP